MSDLVSNIINGERLFKAGDARKLPLLNEIISNQIAIYGLGECAHWFYEIGIKRLEIKPLIALDQKPPDKKWYGIQTSTAQTFISETELLVSEIEVIVCIGSRSDYSLIRDTLLGLGFKRIHFLHDFYEFHSFFVWDPDEVKRRIQTNKPMIQKAFSLVSEDLSKEIFCRLLQVHVTREPLDIPSSTQDLQYFPNDLPFTQNYHTYVCCGAYDGENIRRLKEKIGKTKNILCFEPEPKIFSKLAACARQHVGDVAHAIICFHNAVYDHNGALPFISGDGLGSRLDKNGKDFVQCVKLDDALSGFNPTFISMDIEGAEVAALRGCQQMIANNLPDLAICVYHYPEQIAEVIETINNVSEEYQFYIRNYTGYLTETVVHATTKILPIG